MAPSDFISIPIIDLTMARLPATKTQLLHDLRHALTCVGFLYVTNHGVSDLITGALIDALPTLFRLSETEKKKVALDNSPHFLGYSGTRMETTAGAVDMREQFECATELRCEYEIGRPDAEKLKGPTNGQTLIQLSVQSEHFLHLVAEALALSPDTFLSFLSDQHRLKLVHYPVSEGSAGQGVGPHKDSSGWWTFLLQASLVDVGGLQVLNKSGTWMNVPNIPGTYVVNIGQGFEFVTNGVCKATTHRVLSGCKERFSVPFFQGMRRDLTKAEAVGTLREHFEGVQFGRGVESEEGSGIDSAFLRGKYDTRGEAQLRTKIRSHQDVGRKFYGHVFEKYIKDD